MNFVKKYKRTLLITVLFAVGAIYWSGCSGCSGEENPASKNTEKSDVDLVCKNGEAWIMNGTDGGYIFAFGGELIAVAKISDGRWYGETVGTYSIDGNKLTLVDGEASTSTYKISGDKMTLSGEGNSRVFTKKTGIYVNL